MKKSIENDNIILDSREVESLAPPPAVLWSDQLPPHTLENVGEKEFWVISVEQAYDLLTLYAPRDEEELEIIKKITMRSIC